MRLPHCICIPTFAAGLLTCLGFLSVTPLHAAGEPPVPAVETNAVPVLNGAVEDALRQLKEQQASTFQVLELIRGHTETALQHNAAAVSNQLVQFHAALASHSDRQIQLLRSAESRTLRVTMLILLVVLIAVALLLLLAARTLRGIVPRLPSHSPAAIAEPMAGSSVLRASVLGEVADSAYTSALLEVEKRIEALETKPPVTPPAQAAPIVAARRPAAASKPRPNPTLALALGQGEALMFLPREHSHGVGRVFTMFGRIGRLFRRDAAKPRSVSRANSSKG
jgi:hypothetical protein